MACSRVSRGIVLARRALSAGVLPVMGFGIYAGTANIAAAAPDPAIAATGAASFPAFTWISGSNTADAKGVYGTQGVAAPSNTPGARHGALTWTDAAGNLWLFGGYGVGSPIFNDLWKYSPASGEWTWVGGSSAPDATAVYGTLDVPAATNTPGGLGSAYSWTDASGNLWLFGGFGYDSTGARGWLNALWEYSPKSGMWTWCGGSTTVGASGVYGTQGVAAATNMPGARYVGGWKDVSGNVWLFGGTGYDSTGTLGNLNDLWEYSPASHQWTWVGGSNTVNATGVYGVQGIAAPTNSPGARAGYATWTDARGNLWLFGGGGFDSTRWQGDLNDLWEYSLSSHQWIWVGGSNRVNAKGVYGTQGVAVATNVPGARHSMTAWTDAVGNLWMLGGVGLDSAGTVGELNDVWKYLPSSRQWTWVGGSSTVNAPGVYGTIGVGAATNAPGARDSMATWTGTGSVWLFGGEGHNSTGEDPNTPEWNDLWKYHTR